jgi:hypothetical protein
MTRILHEELNLTKVYAMSTRWDNMQMWAKYADDHHGYCLEFCNAGLFSAAREVQYGTDILVDLSEDDHCNSAYFFRKAPEWSNEEEVRLVVSRTWPSTLSFEPSLLSKVILGYQSPESLRKNVADWAAKRSPVLKVVQATHDAFARRLTLS